MTETEDEIHPKLNHSVICFYGFLLDWGALLPLQRSVVWSISYALFFGLFAFRKLRHLGFEINTMGAHKPPNFLLERWAETFQCWRILSRYHEAWPSGTWWSWLPSFPLERIHGPWTWECFLDFHLCWNFHLPKAMYSLLLCVSHKSTHLAKLAQRGRGEATLRHCVSGHNITTTEREIQLQISWGLPWEKHIAIFHDRTVFHIRFNLPLVINLWKGIVL